MITQNYASLSPAYGRDYKSAKEAKEDFLAGKDFQFNGFGGGGTYCSVRDFQPNLKVNIRYRKLTQVAVVTVPSSPHVHYTG